MKEKIKKEKKIPHADNSGSENDPTTPHLQDQSQPEIGFPIVGIGASAGGLAAFEEFLSSLPTDTDPGMAFVLIQHLSPDHKSLLSDLIKRCTRMQVFDVEDGMTVQVNCAYVIPPAHDMAFLNGTLQLLEPSAPRGQRLPIDFFFRSLALDQRERSIGIILSGTGSDGTLGIRAIKGECGMVMAQSPESAEYDGMPQSAIATGLVDYILAPSQMPKALLDFSSRISRGTEPLIAAPTLKNENSLKKIFVLLRSRTGHDFSHYKLNTIMRRIERRMAVHQIDTLENYVTYLQQTGAEIDTLFRDLLIGVTNFFRDTSAFKFLEETVIPELFTHNNMIRVWSCGCSTGEEAYSIAILLQEYIEKAKRHYVVQVFATDIDPQAITAARLGSYPASIAVDIAPERLSRFFTVESKSGEDFPASYRINKNIRDMVIFSEQNMIKDPPFSKLSLICCRNVMIYLGTNLQKKLIPLFHYALSPEGILFLGTSESVGDYADLFTIMDRKYRLYRRRDNSFSEQRLQHGSFLPPMFPVQNESIRSPDKKVSSTKLPLRDLAEKTLLQRLAPVSALVNGQGDIFYLHGRTGMFLEPSTGEVGIYNILKMAREGLRHEITSGLNKCTRTSEIIRRYGLRVKTNSHFTTLNLSICRANMPEMSLPEPLYLVIMEEAPPAELQNGKSPVNPDDSSPINQNADLDNVIASLHLELKNKEENLKIANEELETSNEELKSSNEEMQSVNEELQSTNEELETSKEELQSVNEELSTVNTELQNTVTGLTRANNDMNNLLAGTGIATVFVDHQLRIMRYTPMASELINLIQTDVGRPFGHIVSNLIGYDSMINDLHSVLKTLVPKDVTVQSIKGNWFTMRILPYRTMDNVIEGAVITFVDITDRKLAEDEKEKLLLEKEILLKEVHHRIKNNIGSIEGLLSMQARTVKNPEALAVLNQAISRVNSMAILYDKLLISEDYQEISVKTYIESLVESSIALVSEKIKILVDKQVIDFNLPSKKLFPLGIIINELLTNIVKYAFKGKEAGAITISLNKIDNHIALIIQDDGTGFPENFDIDAQKGFGLKLIKMLSAQLKGTYSVENIKGTRSTLKFDL